MRIRKTLAVSAAGLSLAAAAALPAAAGTAHHPAVGKHGTFSSTLNVTKGVKTGTKMTIKGTGAKKNTNYICVFAMVKGTQHGQDLTNLGHPKSNKKGKVSCTLTFKAFSATVAGAKHHCPPTKKDKKAGIKCGMALSTANQKSNTIAYFT